MKRHMDKKRAVQGIGKVGKSLHLDKIPGMSHLYNKVQSNELQKSAERWANEEKIEIRKLDLDGYTLCVPPNYYRKWSEGVKKGVEVRECSEYIDKGDTVVDIGGHVGSSMLPLRNLVGDSGRVIVFEPVPAWIRYLKKTIEANSWENITIENMVVGSENGIVDLYIPKPETSQSTINYDGGAKNSQVKVESTTLSDYADANNIDKFDFVKIDVEGGEYDIVCKSNAMMNIEVALIELHPHKMSKRETRDVWDELKHSGEVYSLSGRKTSFDEIPETSTYHIIWESLD